MFKRDFPSLNASPSVLGFGLMRLPVKGVLGKIDAIKPLLGDIDFDKASQMIDYAIANGVNYFDTAYIYHHGKSEIFIREALKKYPRESYYLADKMPGWEVKSEADCERIFSEQLKRCGTEYFDFYLCHAIGKESFKKYEKFILKFLIQKKAEGAIKRLGFSFHDDAGNIGAIADAYAWDFAQIQLNYFDWKAQNAELQYNELKKRGIPIIVMEPVRGGSLASLPKKAEAILKSAAPDKSIASWAMRFCMNLEGVAVVLSGMSTGEHVKDNIATAQNFKPLTDEEMLKIWAAESAYNSKTLVPCTACRYCMDCPFGVDIPKNFELYNEHMINHVPVSDDEWIQEQLAVLGKAAAEHCKTCRKCEKHCPQKIMIAERLKSVAQLKRG